MRYVPIHRIGWFYIQNNVSPTSSISKATFLIQPFVSPTWILDLVNLRRSLPNSLMWIESLRLFRDISSLPPCHVGLSSRFLSTWQLALLRLRREWEWGEETDKEDKQDRNYSLLYNLGRDISSLLSSNGSAFTSSFRGREFLGAIVEVAYHTSKLSAFHSLYLCLWNHNPSSCLIQNLENNP